MGVLLPSVERQAPVLTGFIGVAATGRGARTGADAGTDTGIGSGFGATFFRIGGSSRGLVAPVRGATISAMERLRLGFSPEVGVFLFEIGIVGMVSVTSHK